jgi:hypothetical protein
MSGGMIRRLISRFRAAKKVVFNRPSNSLAPHYFPNTRSALASIFFLSAALSLP